MESVGSLPHSQVATTFPYPESVRSSSLSHPTSRRSILIFSSNLSLGLPSSLFPSGFPTKILYSLSCPPHSLHAPPFSFFSILSPEQYWVRSTDHSSSSLCSILHSPVTSSLLGPNILLSTLFSNILSLRSYLNISDQVSHPNKTTGNWGSHPLW